MLHVNLQYKLANIVQKNKDLDFAIQQALAYTQGPTLIEVQIDPSDCNKELDEWGKCVSEFNSRKDTA